MWRGSILLLLARACAQEMDLSSMMAGMGGMDGGVGGEGLGGMGGRGVFRGNEGMGGMGGGMGGGGPPPKPEPVSADVPLIQCAACKATVRRAFHVAKELRASQKRIPPTEEQILSAITPICEIGTAAGDWLSW